MRGYYATCLDQTGPIPPLAVQMWLKHLTVPSLPLDQASFAVLVIHSQDKYLFDEPAFDALAKAKLPVIVLDYHEPLGQPEQFRLLFEALKRLNVVGWFKRELKANYVVQGCPVWPLDFTVRRWPQHDIPEPRTMFDQRPLDILMMWGYSHLDRVRLHGALMTSFESFRSGTAPAQTLEDVEMAVQHNWSCPLALLYTPHYRRIPLEKTFWLQSKAKITISLFGNGMRCFRNSEAGYNSVMALQAPEALQWSYPWLDQHNCLALENYPNTGDLDLAKAVEKLRYWTVVDHGALYTLYEHGTANNQRYINATYAQDYLLPLIKTVCAI